MAYSKELKRYNFAFNQDDVDRFEGVKGFICAQDPKYSDADVFRFCVRDTFLRFCKKECTTEILVKIAKNIEEVREELFKVVRGDL